MNIFGKIEFVIVPAIIITLIIGAFILITIDWSGAKQYDLSDYTCKEIENSIKNLDPLIKYQGLLGLQMEYFDIEETEISYKYRCLQK